MARARNIKPGFFHNESLAECCFQARLLFAGLWTLADREGRLEDLPKRIKAQVFPYDDADMAKLLGELELNGFIKRYSAEGVNVIWIESFLKNQNPHHTEKDSELPVFNGEVTVKEREINGTTPADSLFIDSPTTESPITEEEPAAKATAPRFKPPSLEEVEEYCLQRKRGISAQKWMDYYTANGWRVGKVPMKDWKAAVRTWENTEYATPSRASPANGTDGISKAFAALAELDAKQ